jgi:hypothetical protein
MIALTPEEEAKLLELHAGLQNVFETTAAPPEMIYPTLIRAMCDYAVMFESKTEFLDRMSYCFDAVKFLNPTSDEVH